VIQLRSVSRVFDAQRPVLRGLNLDVAEGEMVAVVGRSGAGKTTLLNVIGGLDTGYQGSVEISSRRLAELDDRELSAFRNRSVGFVFQAYNLLDELTAAENVVLPSLFTRDRVGAEGRSDLQQRALAALAAVGLADRCDDRPAVLSGGERQRVAIARALLSRPAVLLADEPTGNLDTVSGDSVIALFSGMVRDGVTILVVTHEERVSAAAGRILHLEEGRLR
jgi:putative ABC transport system ATP-binding protein